MESKMDLFLIFTALLMIIFIITLCIISARYNSETLTPINPNNFKISKEADTTQFTAVIIEPRKHKALEFVLNNFLQKLDNKWNFIIYHGTHNKTYIDNIIGKMPEEYQTRITMINMNVKNLTINEYSRLLTSEDFYKLIPTEVFLIFQTDSIICDNTNNAIEQFVEYDYVGAPWSDGQVGNGGLSLRRKTKMLEIIRSCPYTNGAEDLYFCKECPSVPQHTPETEIAKTFSIETIMSNHSFGVHKPWPHLPEHMDTIKSICPGLDTLLKLQSSE